MLRLHAGLVALSLSLSAAADPVDPALYFPLTDGASWTHAIEGGGSTTLAVQPGSVSIGGAATREVRYVAGEDAGSSLFYTNTSGIHLYREFDAVESDTIDYSPPQLLATSAIDLGTSLSTNGTATLDLSGVGVFQGTYSLSWEITARGPMDTPAGFFCDVIVRHEELSVEVEEVVFASEADQYYVRGVGLVAETGFDGEPYSSTLTSTTLPLPPADGDCDGIGDTVDNCPHHASDDLADADGDGRGDVCECGDQNGDGSNTVSDLIAINVAIFNPGLATPLCDANNDANCDVGDIIATNVEIFSVGSTSTCSRQPEPGP
jgi:hypothetical protein